MSGSDGVRHNDFDSDDSNITVRLLSQPQHNTGTFTLAPDGSFTYTPQANFVGVDSFSYVATDGNRDSEAATVTIVVKGDDPVAITDVYEVQQDTVLQVSGQGVRENDIVTLGGSEEEGVSVAAVLIGSAGQHGTAALSPDKQFNRIRDTFGSKKAGSASPRLVKEEAVTERGMKVNIQAGTPEAPSIAVALENYLKVTNRN